MIFYTIILIIFIIISVIIIIIIIFTFTVNIIIVVIIIIIITIIIMIIMIITIIIILVIMIIIVIVPIIMMIISIIRFTSIVRLRKAQRLREEVALGQQKTSTQRLWPCIQIQTLKSVAEKSESVISSESDGVELLPMSWITDITNKSIVTGQVSPAQRLLVIERDSQILKFIEDVSLNVENALKNCNLFLIQVRVETKKQISYHLQLLFLVSQPNLV